MDYEELQDCGCINSLIEVYKSYGDKEKKAEMGKDFFHKALAHFKNRDFDLAIINFTTVIFLSPYNAQAFNNRGLAYEKNGERNKAMSDYTQAIDLDENCGTAFCNRSLLFLQAEKFSEAQKDNAKAMELKDAVAFYNRGVYFHKKEKYVREPRYYYHYGKCVSHSGFSFIPDFISKAFKPRKFKNAIKYYTKAIDLNPNFADAFNNRGNCYEETEQARNDYARVVALEPNHRVYNLNKTSIEENFKVANCDRCVIIC
jgi:tetratricopeptide (TPR) repeat protein